MGLFNYRIAWLRAAETNIIDVTCDDKTLSSCLYAHAPADPHTSAGCAHDVPLGLAWSCTTHGESTTRVDIKRLNDVNIYLEK